MKRKELISRIKEETSMVEFFKLKETILKTLAKTELAKKLAKINSVAEFFSHKTDILNELEKKEE